MTDLVTVFWDVKIQFPVDVQCGDMAILRDMNILSLGKQGSQKK